MKNAGRLAELPYLPVRFLYGVLRLIHHTGEQGQIV